MSITLVNSAPTPADATFESTVNGLRSRPVEFIENLVRTYGDLVRLPFGDRDLYVLNHPDFIRDMFIGNPDAFGKRKDGEAEREYLEQISGIVPVLNQAHLPEYAPAIVRAAERANQRWRAQYAKSGPFEVDIYREMGRITLEIVIQTLFGVDAEAEASELFEAIRTMNAGYGFNPVEATLAPFLPRVQEITASESSQARALVQNYIDSIAARNGSESSTSSFLKTLVKHMGVEKASSVAMIVMFAMHEVTDTTLPWTWRLLSEHPEIEAGLCSELDVVTAGAPPAYDDIPKLSFTGMILEEVRRLYPSVWMVVRFVRKDHQFGEVMVPANSIVLASQNVMHRDPRYFPEPERFDPWRWTLEARRTRPQFSYFPFSAGPRACAGEAFAKMEDVLVLGTLAQHWRALHVEGQQTEPIPAKSNAPVSGIRMILEPRQR